MSEYVGEGPYSSPTFGKSLSLRVDGGFNAVSINPSGRDVVLASRKGLYVVDLDDPFSEPRWLHHLTSWEVADVQWCPHPAKHHWVISTSNQKAIVWNLSRSSSKAVEHVLHGHFRAITDINFHPLQPEILATSSIDTYALAWDMRSPKKPYFRTSNWRSGAAQVKWNHKNSNVLATSHSNIVYVWDVRKGTSPLSVLEGHSGSVNSIDFNPFNETEIMSSGNDGTVKFWDYNKVEDELQMTITTEFPVWRGRYLPFGDGYCIMPMIGGNNSVYLANSFHDSGNSESRTTKLQPTYVFKGHTDRVTDFLWRSRHSQNTIIDDREFQLVTWSKDCDLRLWPVPDMVYDKVHYECGKELPEKLPDYDYDTFRSEPENNIVDPRYTNIEIPKETFVTKSGLRQWKADNNIDQLQWISGVRMHNEDSPHDLFEEVSLNNLGEEVTSVGHKFPRIVFEKISVSTGELIITLNGPWVEEDPEKYIFMRIIINFPPNYPMKGNEPAFKIEENRELKEHQKTQIMERLREISKKYVDANRYCLEPCLQYLLGEEVNLDISDMEDDNKIFSFDFEDVTSLDRSSLGSSDDHSDAPTEISSVSDVEFAVGDGSLQLYSSTPEPKFDSTPVPNGCGAVWTAQGTLVCFFRAENKTEKKQHAIINVGRTGIGGFVRSKNVQSASQTLKDNVSGKQRKPKTYREALSINSQHASESLNQSSDSDSDDSDDSYAEFLDDILKNDLTLRTRMPMMPRIFRDETKSTTSVSGKTTDSNKKSKSSIVVQDFKSLIPDKKELAEQYILFRETPEFVAKYNAGIAESYGYEDIAQCWRMISNVLIGRGDNDFYNYDWDQHSLGGKLLVKRLFEYFEKCQNLQMLAMMSCIFATLGRPDQKTNYKLVPPTLSENIITFYNNEYEPSPHVHSTHGSFYSNDTGTQNARMRYGTNQASLNDGSSIISDDYFHQNHHANGNKNGKSHNNMNNGYVETEATIPDIKIKLIHDDVLDLAYQGLEPSLVDPKCETKFRQYRTQYAEILYIWGLPMDRAELLKFNVNLNTEPEYLHGIEQDSGLDIYKGVSNRWIESNHGHTQQNCSYCGLKAGRLVFVCGNCQHVTHRTCAEKWWKIGDECPSGCSCDCIKNFDVSEPLI
ncbi:Mtc5p [Kluyveromyces lactis]|uniref:KLLA0F19734p n=1 Tax=Kluyveromyces lactis (strain ATCC 8585 / CBS 2359 / DSM 70799 / NBRC 1267 / NRRL Y-1140 / WM37) TaxID=284590 RepID=Q6CJC3_KLULA|nr:uncharacterized protein KLLA0_F19734g [Kluyveromyces lactis]CAG98674.1 KLLA0F19734p [Kluyveromyces lactis]|eukprot:XP_455966.1 uncharacterized protein KLLA0_F19734g [Kluyveromyces lactis]